MKNKISRFPALSLAVVAMLALLNAPPSTAVAQGTTAFTYQGRLCDGTTNATGLYDFRFAVFNGRGSGSSQVGGPVDLLATPVTNGLFTVLLDFGDGVFTGGPRWLEIAVNTNNGSAYRTTLSPRQQLTPTPYAILANTASNLLGTLPAAQLTGTPAAATNFSGSLGGDVTGTQGATVVGKLQGIAVTTSGLAANSILRYSGVNWVPASDVISLTGNGDITVSAASGNVTLGDTATSANTANTIVKRDGSGNFASANITLTGDLMARRLKVGVNHTLTGDLATIAGGSNNTASATFATVSGGIGNSASGPGAVVGGGGTDGSVNYPNVALGAAATVGGGINNSAHGSYGTVGGGVYNTSESEATVGGGDGNFAIGEDSTIGGGEANTASAWHATIGGGYSNRATNDSSTIGGGDWNIAGNVEATVGGGYSNGALGQRSTVAGGADDHATSYYDTVAGGADNIAGGGRSFVGGGTADYALGASSVVGGGQSNVATNTYATVGGGDNNTAGGQESTVGGGGNNNASGYQSTIAGGSQNTATIGQSTVGGGIQNNASAEYATVAGGGGNNASGFYSAIGGGQVNTANNNNSVVGGGYNNQATGSYSTVPGGWGNQAQGYYSFAAGHNAIAESLGSFVWADSSSTLFDPYALAGPQGINNSFNVRSTGGFYIATGVNATNGSITSGLYVGGGGGAWVAYSDRNGKDNFKDVNQREILEKVAALPMTTWNYKTQDGSIRHLGPMAQDFKAAFNLGESPTGINTIDADGVALAAIQGLNQKVEEKDAEIQALKQSVAELKALVEKLAGN